MSDKRTAEAMLSGALNTYRLRATALCPVDGMRDHYDVEVRTSEVIEASTLRAFFDARANTEVFQEDLSREAAAAFCGLVTIKGDHPAPVSIEATA